MNEETIKKILKNRPYQIRGDELHTLCPNKNHGDEHLGNFSINLISGKAHCFVCSWAGSFISFCVDMGYTYPHAEIVWQEVKKDGLEFIKTNAPPIDDFYVRRYRRVISQYALERVGGDVDLLELYEIWADESDNPIFFTKDFEGLFRSVWVKDLSTTKGHNYFLLDPTTAKSDGQLFGLHLPPTDYTVLVEGFFDAPHVYKATGQKTVSMMGTSLTNMQLANLKYMQPIVVMMDFDKAGRNARDKLHEQLINLDSYYCGSPPRDNCDPDELTQDELIEMFKNKKSWLDYALTVRNYDNMKEKKK